MPTLTEQDLIQGMDVVITAAGTGGPVLAGATNGELTVTHRSVPYPQLNSQVDIQLPGKITLEGRLMGAWHDMDAFAALFGASAVGVDIRTRPPKFTVTWSIDAPGKPSHLRRMQMTGCTIQGFPFTTRDAENAVDNPVTFVAEGFAVL